MRARALASLAGVFAVGLVVAAGIGARGTATTSTCVVGGKTGQCSAPEWFPLRHGKDGSNVKVGCTYLSYGSQGGYDCNGYHSWWALDLLVPNGSPVYAAGAGFATRGSGGGYGYYIDVDHGSYGRTRYAHLSSYNIPTTGAWVDQNSVIGYSGNNSGVKDCTYHLHFEKVNKGGTFGSGGSSVDPGDLKACHGTTLVTYPSALTTSDGTPSGLTTWQGIPWGVYYGYSDGTTCGGTVHGKADVFFPTGTNWEVSYGGTRGLM